MFGLRMFRMRRVVGMRRIFTRLLLAELRGRRNRCRWGVRNEALRSRHIVLGSRWVGGGHRMIVLIVPMVMVVWTFMVVIKIMVVIMIMIFMIQLMAFMIVMIRVRLMRF